MPVAIFDPYATPPKRCLLAQQQLAAYRGTISNLLVGIGDPEEKASQASDAYTSSDPQGDPDVTRAVEQAIEQRALDVLGPVRQSMLNLFAAGLFHLLEQLLASVCVGEGTATPPPKDTKLAVLRKWYQKNFKFSLGNACPAINELRLVANVVKHGEGDSAQRLGKCKPELFEPWESWHHYGNPLAGGDLFISDDNLEAYFEAAEHLLHQLSEHLEQNAADSTQSQ